MSDADFLSALHGSAFDLLRDESPIDRVHRHIDGDAPFDRELWSTIADLGWTMIAVPEEHGGMGGGAEALSLLQEAIGAHAAPLPFLGTVLLGEALAAWPDEALSAELLPALAGGTLVGGSADLLASKPLRLVRSDQGITLEGETTVLDGVAADWLLVRVEDAATPGLALLPATAPGLSCTARPVADRTRAVAELACNGVAVGPEQLVLGDAAAPIADKVSRTAMLLLAADAIGGATAILDLTVEYLKTRVQFGKPIGSFQALKHRIADVKASLEMAHRLLIAARRQADGPDAGYWAAMAKSSACEAYVEVASEAVQMHGGIGFTWEHPAHIYLKRATLDRALFGSTAALRDRVGAALLDKVA